MIHYWSASKVSFYAGVFMARYQLAGSWPDDAVEVTEDVFTAYGRTTAPSGQSLGVGSDGMPAWVDAKIQATAPEKQYKNRMDKGLTVTCSDDASLCGVYSVTDTDISDINDELQFISAHGEFSSGASLQWSDEDANAKTFTSLAAFQAFAKCVFQYVSACRQARRLTKDGVFVTWPANTATFTSGQTA